MSTPNPATAAASSGLVERMNKLSQQIGQHEAGINHSSRLMGTIGIVALLLLSGYFYYGYGMIAELLEPKKLVPLGAQMLDDNVDPARESLVQLVRDSAPTWADQLSKQAQDAIPMLREQLENYVMTQSDDLIGQATTVTEEKFRAAITEHRDVIEKGFKELAISEKLSEESLAALVSALEEQMQADMREQAEIVLDTLRHLASRVARLQSGQGLNKEEKLEREVLMIARRLQIMEADPRPIAMPKKSASVATKGDVPADDSKPGDQPGGSDDSKPDKPADDKPEADKSKSDNASADKTEK